MQKKKKKDRTSLEIAYIQTCFYKLFRLHILFRFWKDENEAQCRPLVSQNGSCKTVWPDNQT